MGLSNLKMQADAESDGEITECENTPSEEEAMIEYQMTMDAWGDYLKSVRIQHSLKTRERSPTPNWESIRKNIYQNCVLGHMGLSNLKMQADAESDGEITECENTPSEEEAMIEYQMTMDAWGDYLKSVRIQHSLKVNLQNLMQDLINSSLTIKEQEDPIGMSCTSLSISSGDLIHDWGELFETEPTRLNQLTACLVYASIFIPAMVVKYGAILKTTQKKAARLHRSANATGGGPAMFIKLTDFEQRVLKITGVQAATGLTVEEAGLPQVINTHLDSVEHIVSTRQRHQILEG
ncbi:unnamed protein product [Arctia plantaginis]|uniref:Uncharacterized protein n=1 Tax=Arctia plantaginis TaxID=874455 RepID=A0A8S0ZUH3_ARCPL|nr:unnamed protein product [Arctia plantaginis]